MSPADQTPIGKLFEVCDRAVAYRRQQSDADLVGCEIEALPYVPPFRVDGDGWAMVGTIADGCAPAILEIWCDHERDRIRVQKPPVWPERTPSTIAPLRRAGLDRGIDSKPFIAQPGFVYTFSGVDYDADTTEFMTALNGSIDGWTWRHAG